MVVPASWRRSIHPRRGGIRVAYVPVTDEVPDWPGTRAVLADPGTEPAVAEAGLAVLDGAAPTPLGAAAVATVLLCGSQVPRFDHRAVADGWIARLGLPFAAAAAVEVSDLMLSSRNCPVRRGEPVPDGECGERYCPGHLSVQRARSEIHERGPMVGTDPMLGRVRVAVAAAPDDVHAAVLEALAPYRDGSLRRRIATSFLDPTQTAWVDADAAELDRQGRDNLDVPRLLAAVHTPAQAALVRPWITGFGGLWSLGDPTTVHTLAEGLGDGILDIHDRWREPGLGNAAQHRTMLATLAVIPTDRAFQELLDGLKVRGAQAAVEAAAERFPERAMRLMTAAADRPMVVELLRRHVSRHPALAPADPPWPSQAVLPPAVALPSAALPAVALPSVLVAPPWTVRRKRAKPVVLADLHCTDEPTVSWPPGVRERLLARLGPWGSREDPEQLAGQLRAGTLETWYATDLFESGPEDLARSLLPVWEPTRLWGVHYWLPRIIARFGVAALPLVLRIARRSPIDGGPHLLPFTAPEIALLAADWHGRLKAARVIALDWLRRHPAAAARALVPAALGKPGPDRRNAGQALLALASSGHRQTVLATADDYGPAAGAAIRDLLDTDPLDVLPARIPAQPGWADPADLPPIRLRDGSGTLPADAVQHLITMLMLSKLGDPYAGVAIAHAACDPSDLARFAWALLQRWEGADAPPADSWALDAQAVLGDDETATRLGAAVRDWPYQGAHKRAATGLDVLAQLGTDAALTQLQDIATKMKAKAVKSRAELKLREVAEALELTPDQLADRLVPHLDLTPDATFTLDYGPRRFVAGFDAQLKPYVLDESGTHRKDLPDPTATDHPRLAPAAQRRFTDAKKVVRKVATEQVHRLEHAMVMQRHWSGADFRRTFLQHPLLWPIARRLVWLITTPPDRAGRGTGNDPGTSDHSAMDGDDDTGSTGAGAVGGLSNIDGVSVPDTGDGIGGRSAMDGNEGTSGTGAGAVGGLSNIDGVSVPDTGDGIGGRSAMDGDDDDSSIGTGGTTGIGTGGTTGIGGGIARDGVAVRLAEDRTLAGVGDELVELSDDAVVSVAHPVHLDVRAWSEVFADYEILQPFRQLARDVHALTAQELTSTRLARYDDRKALTVKLLGLERRGWRRSGQDGGHQGRIERDLPGGATLIVDLDPGIAMGAPTEHPQQSLHIWICPDGGNQWSREHAVPFSTLDPAAASELLRDLNSCF
ncbi:hypothetical protein GCM10010532_013730 [Dactylosporangium siamense]